MDPGTPSVLVVGFNTRPLAYSLNNAGYIVYSVDFFGDIDLFPYVKGSIIITKKLGSNYHLLKEKYNQFLVDFTVEMLQTYNNIDYLLIGSGLDNDFKGRELIYNEIKNYGVENINNSLVSIKKARDIERVYDYLKSKGIKVPITYSFDFFDETELNLDYPFILKKKYSAGGTNVFKIDDKENFDFQIKKLKKEAFNPKNWLIQEYIEGIPVSCTTISNGHECEVISINRQIIGEKLLNVPKDFMYCGNIVPANLLREDNEKITDISFKLSKKLGLTGINGYDFVLRDHYPILMEINPRIPGSIRVSEEALGLNLLDLNIKCYSSENWKDIKNLIQSHKPEKFATKLVFFAPNDIDKKLLTDIYEIKYVHDKSDPNKNVIKAEPLCTILYQEKDFNSSYFGALKIADQINRMVSKNL